MTFDPLVSRHSGGSERRETLATNRDGRRTYLRTHTTPSLTMSGIICLYLFFANC